MNKVKKLLFIPLLIILLGLTACSTSDFSIEFAYKYLEMNIGEVAYLTTNYSVDNNVVEWSSSDPLIVRVDNNGRVEALAVGDADIEAKFEDKTSKISIHVSGNNDYELKISIIGKQQVLVNETIELFVEGNYEKTDTFIWTSSDTSVATVADNGTVCGHLPGLVNIRATLSTDSSVYADYSILVKKGSGVQDIIYNYIYNYSYNISGEIDLTSLNAKVTGIIDEVIDGVMMVYNYSSNQKTSLGSGFIIDKKVSGDTYLYTLMTNAHVVDGGTSFTVYIGDDIDKEIKANLIKENKNLDLALLTFEYSGELKVQEFGELDSYKQGDFVLAIGTPINSVYYNTVTFGMVSYPKRNLPSEAATFIQHDAAINSGNSGGPLFDMNGKVIGVNTLKIATTSVEGMGFSVGLESIMDFLNN